MNASDRGIAALSDGIVEMVRRSGGIVARDDIRTALVRRGAPKTESVVRLAVQRALATNTLRVVHGRWLAARTSHRLKQKGMERRCAVLEALDRIGGAAEARTIYRRVDAERRPPGMDAMYRLLHFMVKRGLIVRVGRGWYGHPRHEEQARRDHASYCASLRSGRMQEKIAAAEARRAFLVAYFRRSGTNTREVSDLFAASRAAGHETGKETLYKDLAALMKEGRIERVRRGRYRLTDAEV